MSTTRDALLHRRKTFMGRRAERGATMVESAVILVPLLAIFFAIIDFGMAIFLKNTMQFAVRQGVRYAITSQTMAGMGQDQSIKTVVNQYSMGFLDYVAPNHDGMAAISISYYNPV